MISEQGFARIRGVLRRRRRWALATGTVVLLAGLSTVAGLPPAYKAQVILRALESQPHKDYVPPTVVEQAGERLKTLRLSVMARPVLEQVVSELNLTSAMHESSDEVVDELRRRIEVKVEGEDTFLVTFEDSDAVRAQAVVNRVAALFVARQIEQREQTAAATVTALNGEVAALTPLFAKRQEDVLRFKLDHNGALPEQQEPNLRTLDQTTLELNILSTNLDLNEERRRQLLLGGMSPMRQQEAQLSTALHEARTRYTPEHPEVVRIAAELDTVRGLRVADEQKRREGIVSDPELSSLTREIDRQQASMKGLRAKQDEVRARIADTPENGQRLVRLETDLDVVRTRYQLTVGKLHDAELAAAVERGLRGLRYDTVESAARPLHPIRPNRPLFTLVAVVLALLCGVGAGFARDAADGAIHAPEELLVLRPGTEVLACVPDLPSLDGLRARPEVVPRNADEK